MSHICNKILRTCTPYPPIARAARNKINVSYIEIIGIKSLTTWARWRTQPVEIKATRVGFPTGDLGLINWVSYGFVSKSKCLEFDPRSSISCVS